MCEKCNCPNLPGNTIIRVVLKDQVWYDPYYFINEEESEFIEYLQYSDNCISKKDHILIICTVCGHKHREIYKRV